MDPQEILHGAQELAKAGAAIGAVVPFTALVKRMLGPAADEIAERARDEIRLYRYGRQLSLLHKAEQMAVKAGFSPKAVPVKPLFALLEGASLEEDENLHTKWASLLANAANPTAETEVRPSFMETLKLMTPEMAIFLDAVFLKALEASRSVVADSQRRRLALVNLGSDSELFALFAELGCTSLPAWSVVTSASGAEELERYDSDRIRFSVLMEELTRFQMWSVSPSQGSGTRCYLSAYAVEFLIATHPPNRQEEVVPDTNAVRSTEQIQSLFEQLATHRPPHGSS